MQSCTCWPRSIRFPEPRATSHTPEKRHGYRQQRNKNHSKPANPPAFSLDWFSCDFFVMSVRAIVSSRKHIHRNWDARLRLSHSELGNHYSQIVRNGTRSCNFWTPRMVPRFRANVKSIPMPSMMLNGDSNFFRYFSLFSLANTKSNDRRPNNLRMEAAASVVLCALVRSVALFFLLMPWNRCA